MTDRWSEEEKTAQKGKAGSQAEERNPSRVQ